MLADRIKLYIEMTRPGVLGLVLFTALPIFAIRPSWYSELSLAALIMIGAGLTGAACSVLNAYVDRDFDARMARTRSRPIPAASVAPAQALGLGIVLSVVSTLLLWSIEPLAAAIGLGSILFYVLVYTLYLKPRTVQNIVIGGAAGATTPLIADAALTGQIGINSVLLFLIVFFWTPPHVWAIALYRKHEYEAAGIPMMPSKVGDQPTRWRQLAYSVFLVGVTLLPALIGDFSWAYGGIAGVLGAWLIYANIKSIRVANNTEDRAFFMVTNLYLLALFAAMIVDGFWF